MIGFVAGALIGGTLGVTAMCLCRVASYADSQHAFSEHENN